MRKSLRQEQKRQGREEQTVDCRKGEQRDAQADQILREGFCDRARSLGKQRGRREEDDDDDDADEDDLGDDEEMTRGVELGKRKKESAKRDDERKRG